MRSILNAQSLFISHANNTFPEFLNYAKTGVTHFCGKKASDSNTLSASLLIFKISHPLEKKKCIF